VIEPLGDRLEKLIEYEATLNDRIRQIYRDSLEQPLARHAFRVVVRELAWRYLGERIGWLMGLAVWLRARASVLNASFHVARLGLGRWNLIGLARAGVSVMHAMLRGMVPLQRILTAMGPKYREEIRSIQADAKRFLEDQQLDRFAPASLTARAGLDAVDGGSSTGSARPGASGGLPSWMFNPCGTEPKGTSWSICRPIWRTWASRPPTASGLGPGRADQPDPHRLCRTCPVPHRPGLVSRRYLPAAFYGMAISLLLVSLLPGYLLLALRMRRACAALDPRSWSTASSIRWPPRRCGRCASG
jgi:hypothetical protein